MAERENCRDCDQPLEEDDWPRCPECQGLEDGELWECACGEALALNFNKCPSCKRKKP